MKHGLTLLAISLFLTRTAPAQDLALPPPGSPRLTFDVISIHPARQQPAIGVPCGILPLQGGNGYQVRCMNIRIMIAFMYKIPDRQIANAPAWLSAEYFDIDAKADKVYSIDDLHTMFQNMLVDRFGLKFHTELRQGNIFALTIDSSGLKMKPSTAPASLQGPFGGGIGELIGTRVPMNNFCWRLGQFLQNDDRPVVNMTGLTGNYDFKLVYLPELPSNFDKDNPPPGLPPGLLDRPNLFTALREQLGLKLTAQKGPVTYMVIDHIDKPSEN